MYKNTLNHTINEYEQTHNNIYLLISISLFIVAVLFKIV
jgi:hypothetical protein